MPDQPEPLTETQARRLAAIVATADGWCPACAGELADGLPSGRGTVEVFYVGHRYSVGVAFDGGDGSVFCFRPGELEAVDA